MKLVQQIKETLAFATGRLAQKQPAPLARNLPAASDTLQDTFFMAQPKVLIQEGDFRERLATEEDSNFPAKARG